MKSSFIVFKMTAQITQTQQKRKKLKKVQGGREIKKKMSKFDRLGILRYFGCIFTNFSQKRWTVIFHFFL